MSKTTRVFARQTFSSLGAALPQIVRFLINDHATITGPGWTIVEAQSASNREVPSDSSNLDSLVSATDWPAETISTGDWIVLESANANNTNHFQLYIEYDTATSIRFMLMPLEDFTTGGGAASPPTFPATAFAEGALTFLMTMATGAVVYSVIADGGMMSLLVDGFGNIDCDWTYIGELEPTFPLDDTRCYVVWDNESLVSFADASGDVALNRLSPLDSSTILTLGISAELYTFGSNVRIHEDGTALGRLFGKQTIFPVGIWFNDSGHQHLSGFMRNIFSIHAEMGNRGTLNERTLMFRNNSAVAAPGIVFAWDGLTDY